MADAIATLADLQARLDWELDLSEEGVAQGAIDDLSDDARFYGKSTWDSTTAPRQVKSLVLRAAVRYVRNPDGYITSRAGDETVQWAENSDAGTAAFTEQERKMLAQIAGRGSGIVSVQLIAHGPTNRNPRYINPYSKGPGGDDAIYAQADSGLFPMHIQGEFD